MSQWQSLYQSKLTDLPGAAKLIQNGDRCMCGGISSTPDGILDALFDRAEELHDVRVGGAIMLAPTFKIAKPELIDHILFCNYFATPLDRANMQAGIHTHVPSHFSDIPRALAEFAGFNTLIVQTTPMDENGYFNAGCSANFLDSMDAFDKVLVEVNEHQPYINGENSYHISQVTAIAENHHPVFELPPLPVQDVDRVIAEELAPYVEDGATLQLGIGSLPNAIGECLLHKKHLGCHTEMISDAYKALFEAGALDNSRKSFHRYQLSSYFTAGTHELYQWLDHNPMVYLNPVSQNNNPMTVASNDNMVAINAAMEIDLTGQCCSESIGPVQYSSTGGAADFVRGTWYSKGGKSFMALHSTYTDKDGEMRSRIVPHLKTGAIVTILRTDVMYVATEYGVVCLRGKSLTERARAMISIAHPDFRRDLIHYAKDVKYFVLPEHERFAGNGSAVAENAATV